MTLFVLGFMTWAKTSSLAAGNSRFQSQSHQSEPAVGWVNWCQFL